MKVQHMKLVVEKLYDLQDVSNKLSIIAGRHQDFIEDLNVTTTAHAEAIAQLIEDYKRVASYLDRIMKMVEMILPAGTDVAEPPPGRVLH